MPCFFRRTAVENGHRRIGIVIFDRPGSRPSGDLRVPGSGEHQLERLVRFVPTIVDDIDANFSDPFARRQNDGAAGVPVVATGLGGARRGAPVHGNGPPAARVQLDPENDLPCFFRRTAVENGHRRIGIVIFDRPNRFPVGDDGVCRGHQYGQERLVVFTQEVFDQLHAGAHLRNSRSDLNELQGFHVVEVTSRRAAGGSALDGDRQFTRPVERDQKCQYAGALGGALVEDPDSGWEFVVDDDRGPGSLRDCVVDIGEAHNEAFLPFIYVVIQHFDHDRLAECAGTDPRDAAGLRVVGARCRGLG